MSRYFDQILSDREKEAIAKFNSDPVMKEALRKCILAGIHTNGTLSKTAVSDPLVNTCFDLAAGEVHSNEEIGADVRAKWAGINALESAFVQLEDYKVEKPNTGEENKTNKAR